MPALLFVTAAAMPANAVPWPLGSVAGSEPAKADQPGATRPARSGCAPSTPVSRTAIAVEPAGLTEPYTESQPIFGSAHCCGYSLSDGGPATLRLESRSTLATTASDLKRAAATVQSVSVTFTEWSCSAAMAPMSVPALRAIEDC